MFNRQDVPKKGFYFAGAYLCMVVCGAALHLGFLERVIYHCAGLCIGVAVKMSLFADNSFVSSLFIGFELSSCLC